MIRKYPILILAYNAAATIGETLASLLNQSSAGLASIVKVVVADDGSTDDTRSAVRQHWRDDAPLLEVWPAERNAASAPPLTQRFSDC